jgi:hypothetical protein
MLHARQVSQVVVDVKVREALGMDLTVKIRPCPCGDRHFIVGRMNKPLTNGVWDPGGNSFNKSLGHVLEDLRRFYLDKNELIYWHGPTNK